MFFLFISGWWSRSPDKLLFIHTGHLSDPFFFLRIQWRQGQTFLFSDDSKVRQKRCRTFLLWLSDNWNGCWKKLCPLWFSYCWAAGGGFSTVWIDDNPFLYVEWYSCWEYFLQSQGHQISYSHGPFGF